MPEFRPYTVRDSGWPLSRVVDYVNHYMHSKYSVRGPATTAELFNAGSHYHRLRGAVSKLRFLNGLRSRTDTRAPVQAATTIAIEPLFRYRRLLNELKQLPNVTLTAFRDMTPAAVPDGVPCAIRHDVDIDIVCARQMAEIERDLEVPATYFILHTSPYYGFVEDHTFYRHGCMLPYYRYLQDLGGEVALHTDAFTLYQHHGIDGAAAIECELEWLRSGGIDICGSVSHNSAQAHGLENAAIFKGRARSSVIKSLPQVSESASAFEFNGSVTPIQVLDEASLGLRYEAGEDFFWQTQIPKEMAVAMEQDNYWWSSYADETVARAIEVNRHLLDTDRLLHELSKIPGGTFLTVTVHPMHFGLRHSSTSGPAIRMSRESICANDYLGWETYAPESLHCRSGDGEGGQEVQTINWANELGMLDYSPGYTRTESEFRLLVLGGTNVNGSSIGIDCQFHQLLGDLLAQDLERPVKSMKLAFPGMGFARLFGWYEVVARDFRPHHVVVAIGADEPWRSLPELWSLNTGFSSQFPPGDYLHSSAGFVSVVPRSGAAQVLRRIGGRARPMIEVDEAIEILQARDTRQRLIECLGNFRQRIERDGSQLSLLVQDQGEYLGPWSNGDGETCSPEWLEIAGAFIDDLANGIPLANPYESFRDIAPLRSHWRSCAEWNYTGHRIAAEHAFATISAHFAHGQKSVSRDAGETAA